LRRVARGAKLSVADRVGSTRMATIEVERRHSWLARTAVVVAI
jgi:Ni,Fe-hydrogenase III large subunit